MLKFVAYVVIFIVIVVAAMWAATDDAAARHNSGEYRQVVKKYIPSREKRVVRTPYCTDSIVFTARGRHIVHGFGIYASTNHVVVVNNRRFGVTARVLCPRR